MDKKLGVTLYLEDMERKAYQGAYKVSSWTSDYNFLKSARNMRNELAHSRNSMTVDICSQEDIDFVRSFRARILNQTDPIAMLRSYTEMPHTSCSVQMTSPHSSSASRSEQTPHSKPTYIDSAPNQAPAGCLGIVAAFVLVIACVIVLI
jgi:hypothetical protein